MNRWRVHVKKEPWRDDVGIYILRDSFVGGKDSIAFVKAFEMKKMHEGDLMEEPSLKMLSGEAHEFLQAMVNAAWGVGIKPTAMEDSANELKATKYHLEDMRKLAKVEK